MRPERSDPLPQHIRDAIEQISAMHVSHHSEASPMERFTDWATSALGTPTALIVILLFAVSWIVVGACFPSVWFDPSPFALLDLFLSLIAILLAVVILASQRREGLLANRREQMTLQLALLTDQKVAKMIDLMEELRRDLPHVHNRVDLEAIEMTAKPDHAAVLDEIQDRSQPSTHQEAYSADIKGKVD